MAEGRVKRFKDGRADPSQFRSKSGMYMTMSLFKESNMINSSNRAAGIEPFYTLKEFDDEENNLPSAYRIYMDAADEYEAIMRLFGSTRLWDRLCRARWFVRPNHKTMPELSTFDGVERWREDKKMYLQSKARRILLDAAEEGNVTAAKKLYDESRMDDVLLVEDAIGDQDNGKAAKILQMHRSASQAKS